MIIMAVGSVIQGFVPMFRNYDETGWIAQMVSLGVALLCFVGLSILAEKLAEKNFDKVDL
jgi:hypothetical protein